MSPSRVRGPLEWVAFAIASRQLSRATAVAIHHRLVARLGGAITAERVLATDEQAMREVGLSHQKARAIRGLAERFDDGLLEPDKLTALSDAELRTEGRGAAQRAVAALSVVCDVVPLGPSVGGSPGMITGCVRR